MTDLIEEPGDDEPTETTWFKDTVKSLYEIANAADDMLAEIQSFWMEIKDSSNISQNSEHQRIIYMLHSELEIARVTYCDLYLAFQENIALLSASTEGAELLNENYEDLSVLEDFFNDFPNTGEFMKAELTGMFESIQIDFHKPTDGEDIIIPMDLENIDTSEI